MTQLRLPTVSCALLGLALTLLLTAAGAPPAAAHPLGNFTVNRYSRLEAEAERLVVHYVLDIAEVPAFQERGTIDAGGDGRIGEAEAAAYAARKAAAIVPGLHLALDGRPTPLTLVDQRLSFPPGQAGLSTLRLELTLTAPLPAGTAIALDYRDDNEPERRGWREIVLRAGGGRALSGATAPVVDASDALRAYPDDLLSSPLDVRAARATVLPAAGAGAAAEAPLARAARARDDFAALVAAETLSVPVVLISLLVAFGLGAAHALSPGHGKTVVAAYLVGARGTARHALFLGATVTITHTAGVFALGLITLFLSQYILPERLYPWLGAVSGLLVVAIGLGLFWSRLRGLLAAYPLRRPLRPASFPAQATAAGWHQHDDGRWHVHHHAHAHPAGADEDRQHAHHAHEHEHGHGHHHHHGPGSHTHLPPGADGEPVTWRGLLALGVSGGLLPCPSALVVLLSAIALHRVGFGLLLIVAFSAGLAAVLTGIGLLLVYAGRLFARLPVEGRLMRVLPVGSALLVTLAGVAITAQALAEAGLLR